MSKSFVKIVAILSVFMLIMNMPFAFAEESPATPTDLAEEQQEDVSAGREKVVPDEQAEESGDNEESGGNAEVIVTKFVRLGDSWKGTATGAKPALLKLDVDRPGTVYLVVESEQIVWATVEKADRPENEPEKKLSDSQTGCLTVSWNAEKGSYLIRIGPKTAESAGIRAEFLDDEGYAARTAEETAEDEQEQPADDAQQEEQPEDPQEEQPEAAFILPANRSVHIDLTWDTDDPQRGDVAHFSSVMTGYENLTYSLQWQTSRDEKTWTDYEGAVEPRLDVVLTEETEGVYFRLVVYVESEQRTN